MPEAFDPMSRVWFFAIHKPARPTAEIAKRPRSIANDAGMTATRWTHRLTTYVKR
jgi:hypothetical protein